MANSGAQQGHVSQVSIRKVSRRSRQGCVSCKLRKLKVRRVRVCLHAADDPEQCDEKRPHCTRCFQAHIDCSYVSEASKSADLKSSHELTWAPGPTRMKSMNDRVELSILNGHLLQVHGDGSTSTGPEQLGMTDLHFLNQFETATVRTFGTWKSSSVYKAGFNKMAAYVSHFVSR